MPYTKRELITPTRATELLEANQLNRRIDQSYVEEYAQKMRDGQWDSDNGQGVVIDIEDNIQDGQHRLWAVIESGKSVDMDIIYGASINAFETIDKGKKRTLSDDLDVRSLRNTGEREKNHNTLAASLAVIWAFDHQTILLGGRGNRPSVVQATKFLEEEPNFRDVVNLVCSHAEIHRSKLMSGRWIVALNYILLYRSEHTDGLAGHTKRVEEFIYQMATGIGLDNMDDPVYRLRKRLMDNLASNSSLPGSHLLALAIKAWNNRVQKVRRRQLTWREDEVFPYLVL